MIFTVSSKLGSNLILQTLDYAKKPGGVISIEGNDLNAPDVVMAVNKGFLIPKNEEEYKKVQMGIDEDRLTIENKTQSLLVLGATTMRPGAISVVKRADVDMKRVIMAHNSGQIEVQEYTTEKVVLTAEEEIKTVIVGQQKGEPVLTAEQEKEIKDNVKRITKDGKYSLLDPDQKQKLLKKLNDLNEKEGNPFSKIEIKEPNKELEKDSIEDEFAPKTWDFRQESLVKAEKTPTVIESKDFVDNKPAKDIVDLDSKEKIDNEESKIKVAKKEKTVETAKVITKKAKTIEPVGEEKIARTVHDAILDLDDRGHPLKKVSEELDHMVEEMTDDDDMFFAD